MIIFLIRDRKGEDTNRCRHSRQGDVKMEAGTGVVEGRNSWSYQKSEVERKGFLLKPTEVA